MSFKYNFSARRKGKGWQLVMDYKDGSLWRQKTKAGFATKRDALAYRQTLLRAVEGLIKTDRQFRGLTLMGFARLYLDARSDITFGTRDNYLRAVANMTEICDRDISRIKYIDVERQMAAFAHLKPRTKAMYRAIIKSIFAAALKYKAIGENPVAEMKTTDAELSKSCGKLRTLTREETQYLIDHMTDSKYHLIIGICATTGVRVGEALGICWKDVDFVNSRISINKQFKRIGRKDGKPVLGLGPVKNKNGNRTVHMPPVLQQALMKWRRTSVLYMDGRLTDIRYAYPVSRTLAGIFPDHSIHDLRHTFATFMLSSGVDIQTVAALLGDSIATVEKTYIHYTEEMRKQAANHLDRFFG